MVKPPRPVWFNAWRLDKEEALWAAFALLVTQSLAKDLPRAGGGPSRTPEAAKITLRLEKRLVWYLSVPSVDGISDLHTHWYC